MVFLIDSKIRVKDPDDILMRWVKAHLILPNPEFYKKEQMGKWTGNTPQFIWLYEKDGKDLVLPFGVISQLMQLFPQAEFKTRIRSRQFISYQSEIDLYDYQAAAVQAALEHKNGIIVMPCGAGKTQTALELISRLSLRCLWLTHTQDLLNQSMMRAKNTLGIDQASYGTITDGKVNIGSGITFATVQTMCMLDLRKYEFAWDMIIVDECHKAVGSPTKVMQFYKVLSNLACRYKFGLTATPKRADGLEKCMFALLGDIIHEVPKEAVAETTCPVHVQHISTEYVPDLDVVLSGDGTINYTSLVDNLIHDPARMKVAAAVIDQCDGPTIVLANRVEYLQNLQNLSDKKTVCLSTMARTKKAKMERKLALKRLNEGELDCIYATYQLAKEGLDVPNLRYVVFATPEKDETTVTQASGRVGRKADGKDYGTVIDLVDNFGMYLGWSKKRNRIYKRLDYSLTSSYINGSI